MSSNIRLNRICNFCETEFTAKTTVTKFCSTNCGRKAYKKRKRNEKIDQVKEEVSNKIKEIANEVVDKEIISVKEMSILLSCSVRTAYRLVNNGTIHAVNLGERLTRIKRSELDKLLVLPEKKKPKEKVYKIIDCYSIGEVQNRFSISEKTLYELIKRNKIPKQKQGKFVYVPKVLIESFLL